MKGYAYKILRLQIAQHLLADTKCVLSSSPHFIQYASWMQTLVTLCSACYDRPQAQMSAVSRHAFVLEQCVRNCDSPELGLQQDGLQAANVVGCQHDMCKL